MVVLRALVCCVLAAACGALRAQDPAPSNPKDRARDARDLGKQGAEALPKLQAMLKDPVADVRVEAVKSIIAIDTAHSLDPLIEATRDNDAEVQIRATDGLVNFYLPGYVQRGLGASVRRVGTAIRARFTDVNDQVIERFVEVRPEVVLALGKLARGGSSMESRANAARAIGILRGREAIPDLIEAVRKSKDDQVMYESLIAFQKIRDPSVAPRIAFLLRDPIEKVQIAAVETTGLLQNAEALPQLKAVLAESKKEKVRRAALTSIAMIPDPGSRSIYTKYLSDRDEGLRAAAAEGLARLKDPADLPALEKAFENERKMSPRLSLAFALVMLGKTEISELSPLQYLIDRLNSSAWRGVSNGFLIELARQPAVRRALEQAAARGGKIEKIELAQILAVSGDQETVKYLEKLSRDPEPEVAQAALTAARSLKARLQ